MENLSQQPGGEEDVLADKQETGERRERVKMSNSRGSGGDLSAHAPKNPYPQKVTSNNKGSRKENKVDKWLLSLRGKLWSRRPSIGRAATKKRLEAKLRAHNKIKATGEYTGRVNQ